MTYPRNEKKLSSENLYHYTHGLSSLMSILRYGFRYSLQRDEKISYRGREISQEKYAVCFCDLTHEDSINHRIEYGSFGIGLKKEWGVKKGISPVMYIHEWSPGNSTGYRAQKVVFWTAMEANITDLSRRNIDWAAKIRAISDEIKKGARLELPFHGSTNNYEHYRSQLDVIASMKDSENSFVSIFKHTFEALMWYVEQLHNELELRDMYLRDFSFYDEKEWRSIFFPSVEDPDLSQMTNESRQTLNEEYNLKFTDDDIVELVVGNADDKLMLAEFLISENRRKLIELIKVYD